MSEGNMVAGGFSLEALTIINQHGESVVIDGITVGISLYVHEFTQPAS